MADGDQDAERRRRKLWLGIGIGCGGCLLLLLPGILIAFILPVYSNAKARARHVTCVSHMRALAAAIRVYQADWDGRLPQATNWRDGLENYVADAKTWHCPADRSDHPSSYAFNPNLSGLAGESLTDPSRVVLLFESASADPNPSDPAAWPSPERHRVSGAGVRGSNVAYVDGRVETKVNLQASDLEAALRPAP